MSSRTVSVLTGRSQEETTSCKLSFQLFPYNVPKLSCSDLEPMLILAHSKYFHNSLAVAWRSRAPAKPDRQGFNVDTFSTLPLSVASLLNTYIIPIVGCHCPCKGQISSFCFLIVYGYRKKNSHKSLPSNPDHPKRWKSSTLNRPRFNEITQVPQWMRWLSRSSRQHLWSSLTWGSLA